MVSRKRNWAALRLGILDFTAASWAPIYIPFLQEFLDVANTVIENQSWEFNQSVPHCFPQKSFVCERKRDPSASAPALWCSSFFPAPPSQLLPSASSLYARCMGKHLSEVFCSCSLNCAVSISRLDLQWKAPVVSAVVADDGCSVWGGFLVPILNKRPFSWETATSDVRQ